LKTLSILTIFQQSFLRYINIIPISSKFPKILDDRNTNFGMIKFFCLNCLIRYSRAEFFIFQAVSFSSFEKIFMLSHLLQDKSIENIVDPFNDLHENSLNNSEISTVDLMKLQSFDLIWLLYSISIRFSINSFKNTLNKLINGDIDFAFQLLTNDPSISFIQFPKFEFCNLIFCIQFCTHSGTFSGPFSPTSVFSLSYLLKDISSIKEILIAC
jgi:hypothetical protein